MHAQKHTHAHAPSSSLQAAGRAEILSNAYKQEMQKYRQQRKAYLAARGSACFDHEYYLKMNPDLK